jgi:hypothetical protein
MYGQDVTTYDFHDMRGTGHRQRCTCAFLNVAIILHAHYSLLS